MPADTVEILEGQEEGVARHNSWGPREILFDERNGQKFVRGVKLARCTQVYDENKRFAPKFDESVTTEIEGDTVLLSVGQSADLSFIDAQRDGVSLARAENEFLERHLLNWLPMAKTKLDRTCAPGFPVMMTLLVQFLNQRYEGS